MKTYFVYIITNTYNSVFYVGVTNNLPRRIFEHKNKYVEGFTSKYSLWKLVYFEETNSISDAITREKQLKNWHRPWKINLIKTKNPNLEEIQT
ncbi:MAG: GIY-YIG nuclease family protein [Patescibacteria group bacterium]